MDHFRNKSNNSCYLLSNPSVLDPLLVFYIYYVIQSFQNNPHFTDEKNETYTNMSHFRGYIPYKDIIACRERGFHYASRLTHFGLGPPNGACHVC